MRLTLGIHRGLLRDMWGFIKGYMRACWGFHWGLHRGDVRVHQGIHGGYTGNTQVLVHSAVMTSRAGWSQGKFDELLWLYMEVHKGITWEFIEASLRGLTCGLQKGYMCGIHEGKKGRFIRVHWEIHEGYTKDTWGFTEGSLRVHQGLHRGYMKINRSYIGDT